jgi:hypothetical protein
VVRFLEQSHVDDCVLSHDAYVDLCSSRQAFYPFQTGRFFIKIKDVEQVIRNQQLMTSEKVLDGVLLMDA